MEEEDYLAIILEQVELGEDGYFRDKGVTYKSFHDNFGEDNGQVCPVCGLLKFHRNGFYEVCPICGWEDDRIQRKDLDYDGGANEFSANYYRKQWEANEIGFFELKEYLKHIKEKKEGN